MMVGCIPGLTCFKCHMDTAVLTYEESRVYKVSCPCGLEYSFEHSSLKRAEEYHLKMLELHGEIDRNKELKEENERLREELGEAVADLDAIIKRNAQCDICGNGVEKGGHGHKVWHCKLGGGGKCSPKWRGAQKGEWL